jgi:hypothetical protein
MAAARAGPWQGPAGPGASVGSTTGPAATPGPITYAADGAAVVAPGDMVASVPSPSQHPTCPLFCPSLHGAVIALLDTVDGGPKGVGPAAVAGGGDGGGGATGTKGPAVGSDLALVAALYSDACRLGRWHHARFLAELVPPLTDIVVGSVGAGLGEAPLGRGGVRGSGGSGHLRTSSAPLGQVGVGGDAW